MSSLYGSICLSDIPRSQMKKIMCKDGKERIFLNIFVGERKEPATFGDRTYTHFVSCSPKKEERKEGETTSSVTCRPTSRNRTRQPPNKWPQPQACHLLMTCLSDNL